MGKLMKTGVILLFVVSLLSAVAAMVIIGRNQYQKTQIANLTDDLNKTKEAKAEVEENLKNMTVKKDSLEEQLAQTQRERDRYKTALTSEKQKTAQLTDDVKREAQAKDNYKVQLAKTNSEVSSLKSQLEKESAKKMANEVRIARLLGKEISKEKLPEEAIEEKQEKKDVPIFNENMVGKILKIDKKTGIIAIDFERDISKHTSKKLVVLRDNNLIDKITVKRIYNTIMVSKIDAYDNIRKIKDGDTVQLLNRDPTEE